jgi:hypothetical protein
MLHWELDCRVSLETMGMMAIVLSRRLRRRERLLRIVVQEAAHRYCLVLELHWQAAWSSVYRIMMDCDAVGPICLNSDYLYPNNPKLSKLA